ncbi:MAG TPA: hypothetical protein VFY36_08575 [Solirubrobacteraceae bacterium]|nr:hypothetical protein [Solirubrobacteraceae bacterium]
MDQHTLLIRRRIAAVVVGVVLLIVIVLLINGCVKGKKEQSLKDYNRAVSQLVQESRSQVSHPLFGALTNATSKSALDVELQIDQLSKVSRELADRAKGLSVPGDMVGAQRNLLTTFDLRAEGMAKVALLVPKALGSKSRQVSSQIAGEMEVFLASDVLYSQRVAPLIAQTLDADGIGGLSLAGDRFLPNLGWLDPATAHSRITGQSSAGGQTGIAPGTHGSSLVGVSVGANTLAVEPTLNHISGGGSPTFTVTAQNTGTNAETDVKVDVTVTAGGKQFKASHAINATQPGNKVNVEIPVAGIPVGAAAKIEVYVEPVPGETNAENNKSTYLALFGA